MEPAYDADADLAARIDTAMRAGAGGADIVQLIRDRLWVPLDDPDRPVLLIEGRLEDGRHVPVRIYPASAGGGRAATPPPSVPGSRDRVAAISGYGHRND